MVGDWDTSTGHPLEEGARMAAPSPASPTAEVTAVSLAPAAISAAVAAWGTEPDCYTSGQVCFLSACLFYNLGRRLARVPPFSSKRTSLMPEGDLEASAVKLVGIMEAGIAGGMDVKFCCLHKTH